MNIEFTEIDADIEMSTKNILRMLVTNPKIGISIFTKQVIKDEGDPYEFNNVPDAIDCILGAGTNHWYFGIRTTSGINYFCIIED